MVVPSEGGARGWVDTSLAKGEAVPDRPPLLQAALTSKARREELSFALGERQLRAAGFDCPLHGLKPSRQLASGNDDGGQTR